QGNIPSLLSAHGAHRAPQAFPTRRSSDLRKERGIWGGALEENRGPHLTAVLLTDGSQVCIVYRRSTRAVPCAALAFPSLRRSSSSEEPTSQLQSPYHTVSRLLLDTRLRRV